MKKGIVMGALLGLASGTIIGIMATSKKAVIWRKKLFQNFNTGLIQMEEKIRQLISNNLDK